MYRLLDWGYMNLKQAQPLSIAPGLGPKVNPPVTLKPKLKSLLFFSSVQHLSELLPCSPTQVKTTHSSTVLSLHLSQCFTPPLKSIPASFFFHAPCPPSLIASLPAILTPVLHMCIPRTRSFESRVFIENWWWVSQGCGRFESRVFIENW